MGDRCPFLKQLPPLPHPRMLGGAVLPPRSAWLGVLFTVITGWRLCSVTIDLGSGSSIIHSRSFFSVLSILECARCLAALACRTSYGTSSVVITLVGYSPQTPFWLSSSGAFSIVGCLGLVWSGSPVLTLWILGQSSIVGPSSCTRS